MYYTDRGYSKEYAKYEIYKIAGKKNIKSENKWESYINNITARGKRPTQKIRKDRVEKYPMLLLFYDNSGIHLNTHVSRDRFMDILKIIDVNIENYNFIDSLYNYYIAYDFDTFKNGDILKSYNLFFQDVHGIKTKTNNRKIEYWLGRGYPKEEASLKITEIQSSVSFSLKRCKELYGDDWEIKFNEYVNKMQRTRKENSKGNPMYGVMYSKTINPDTGEFYTGEALINKRREECRANYLKASQSSAAKRKSGETKTAW